MDSDQRDEHSPSSSGKKTFFLSPNEEPLAMDHHLDLGCDDPCLQALYG